MAKYCANCGNEMNLDTDVCSVCGYVSSDKKKCEVDTVVGPWTYVGYIFLYSLGIVGLILCIVFSINHSNKNIKNLSKAYLLIAGIVIVIAVVLIILVLIGVISQIEIPQGNY